MRKNGFTLVEMLIVVVILGMIAIIAVPYYTQILTDYKISQVAMRMRMIPILMKKEKDKNSNLVKFCANNNVHIRELFSSSNTNCTYELGSNGKEYVRVFVHGLHDVDGIIYNYNEPEKVYITFGIPETWAPPTGWVPAPVGSSGFPPWLLYILPSKHQFRNYTIDFFGLIINKYGDVDPKTTNGPVEL